MKLLSRLRRVLMRVPGLPRAPFTSSAGYWEERYSRGGNSGAGSYGRLASYKADFINGFIRRHGIRSVIEFGCGDGSQASMLDVPEYVGVDVSTTALELCRKRLGDRPGRRFYHADDAGGYSSRYDLGMSLDVIYHLVEDTVFEKYMNTLLDHAERHVLIYSSDLDERHPAAHVRHRCFSRWIADNRPEWRLAERFENPFAQRSASSRGWGRVGPPRTFAAFSHFMRVPG